MLLHPSICCVTQNANMKTQVLVYCDLLRILLYNRIYNPLF
jgi:hypothetical protein